MLMILRLYRYRSLPWQKVLLLLSLAGITWLTPVVLAGNPLLPLSPNSRLQPLKSAPREFVLAQRLSAVNGAADDTLGRSVAISADGLTILGGADQRSADTAKGYATVFMFDGVTGTPVQQKLSASDGAGDDEFGTTAALSRDGNTALVGAFNANAPGSNTGAVYVFIRTNFIWNQQQKLLPEDPQIGGQFGSAVALSPDGNTAFAGAWEVDTGSGAVYVFTRTGGVWSQQQKLTASDAIANGNFGVSLDLSGDGSTLIVGARQYGVSNGAAYVFTRNGNLWEEQQKLTADDGELSDAFGQAVALNFDGSLALIGASGDFGSSGAAYTFTRSGSVWTEQIKIVQEPGDLQPGEEFGHAVDLDDSGNVAVIAARFDDENGANSGAVYIFRQIGSSWTQTSKLIADDAASGNRFGTSAAIDANGLRTVAGSTGSDGARGVVFLFTDLPFTTCDLAIQLPVEECQALVSLYEHTAGDDWISQSGWKTNNAPCTWYGVTCSADHVTRLDLFSNGLTGSLPDDLASLTALEYLNLSDNVLTGNLPIAWSALTVLRELLLAENQLGSDTPAGGIPSTWAALTLLEKLDLSQNQLTGSLPPGLTGLLNLKELDLATNFFSGTLPDQIGNLFALVALRINGNRFTGNIPASFASLTGLSVANVDVGYNRLAAVDPGTVALLDFVDPDWAQTQTVAPGNLTGVDDSLNGLVLNWTPIPYVASGGYYTISCISGATEVSLNTTDKTVETLAFSGLPAGTYTCTAVTFTPMNPENGSDLTSDPVTIDVVYSGSPLVPVNDLTANPILFDNAPRQNYSLNIASATSGGDPLPPVADPDCPVSLTPTAVGIHYRVPGNAPGLGGVGGIVISAGGPIWFSNRAIDGDQTADTAIVIYEETGTNTVGAVVGCDDDDAPGEISISTVKFDLDPAKNYRVVVWNEAEAAQGAIIDIKPATFDLFAPADDLVTELPPTTFSWQPYTGAVNYTLKVGLTTDLSTLTLAQRTPAADSDELTCTADLCTLTVAADSPLDDYLNNGNYLWSVAVSLSDTDPTIPLSDSNQVFRFVIGIETPNLLTNGGFETDNDFDGQPDSWTGKNLFKDKLKCNKPDNVVAYAGTCAYQFKGGSGENASLVQNIDGDQFGSGEQLQLSVQAKGKGFVTGTKITLKVSYADGSKAKSKIGFGTDALAAYTLFTGDPLDLTAAVSSAKLKISHQNPTGKLILDDLWLTTTAARSRTIPLPPDARNPESGLDSRRGG